MAIQPSIHRSMGSAPVGAQCPLTSSQVGDWLWYPGLSPVLVSIALPFALHISVLYFHSSSPAIGFHSSIFLRWRYLTMVIGYPKRLRYHNGYSDNNKNVNGSSNNGINLIFISRTLYSSLRFIVRTDLHD